MAENMTNRQYMQSGGMNSRQTGWPSSSASNMYATPDSGIPVSSSLFNSVPTNVMSIGNQMNYAPHQASIDTTCRPPTSQHSRNPASPWWQHCKISRQACFEFGKLLDAAKDEQQILNYDTQQLSSDDQFHFRKKVQAFLARLCTSQQLLECINADLFLAQFFQPYFFNIVKHVTGIDIEKMPGQHNASQHITRQPQQVPANHGMSQVNQHGIGGGFENLPTRGNIQQFQINGMSTRGNSSFTPTSYVNPPPPYPFQGSTQTNFYQGGSVPDNSRSAVPQNVSAAMPRWYKMPAERYESGRAVKQSVERASSHQRQQEPTGMPVKAGSQPVPLPAVSTYTYHRPSLASQPDYTSVHKEWNYSQQQTSRSAMQPDILSVSVNSNSRSVPQTISQQSNVQSGPADASLPRPLPQQQTMCDSRSQGNTPRDSNCSDLVPQQSVQAPATKLIQPNNYPSTSRKETSVLPDSKEHLRQLMSNTPPVQTVELSSSVNRLESTAKEPVVMPVVEPVVPVAEPVVPVTEPVVPVVEPVAAPVEGSTPCDHQLTEAADACSNISMPVLVEDQPSRKSESSKPVSSLSKQLKNSFDINVPSPFTADVSDSVDRWLSGSKSSELLDTLTSKALEDKRRPCVEKQNQNISSVDKESGGSLPQSDSGIITDDMNVMKTYTGSISQDNTAKHGSVKTTHSENETVSRSLGIYDPPLPVIKHKKRESRISPLKKSNSNTDTDADTPAEDAAHSKGKTIESRRHSEGSGKTTCSTFKKKLEVYKASLDTEPLFSVLDNLSARKTAKSNGNGVTEGKELTSVIDSEKQRHKSAEVSSSSLQLNEEKHKKSHSENRDKSLKHHERTKKCDTKKPISVREQHVNVGERAGTSKDRISHHRSESQYQQESSTISAREKVYSQWSGNQKHTGKPNNVGHARRQSCPDKNGSKCGGNKNKRSLTWDGATPSSAALEEVDSHTEDNAYLPSNGEFIWFHGQKLLMINLPDGKHLIMKEFVKCCLSDYDISRVYKTKTCTLKINHKTLTHSCRREVEKYLSYKKIKFSSQMGVVLLANAQKLYHNMLKMKSCPEGNCVSPNPPVYERSTREEDNLVQKERSVSPDSTVQSNQQSKASTDLTSPSSSSKGDGPDDVQLNKVSSQSQDSEDTCGNDESAIIAPSAEQEDEEGALSDVSDATDIYCDGTPVPKHLPGVTAEEIDEKDCEVIKGGFAIIQKDKMPDRTLRYIVVDGEKCYVYQDLFQLFSKEEVVKVVIHKDMHVAECTADSAHYLSRLEPKLPPVIPGDCFLIKEKYVRKVFAYFGEPYPKLKLIKNGFKRKSSPPLLASETDSHDGGLSPPKKKLLPHSSPEGSNDDSGKKLNHQDKISSKDNDKTGTNGMSSGSCLSRTTGLKRKLGDDCGTREGPVTKKSHLDDIFNESREYILQAFVTLKEQHKQMAADLEYVKTEVCETKVMKTHLEEKCRKQEGDMTSLKSELSVSKEYNVSLEQKYKELEGVLSQLKGDLHIMKEENKELAKERDHNKDFLEKVIGAYRMIDDDDDDDGATGSA